MTQRFYVDQSGRYLGSYEGPDEDMPDMYSGAISVPSSPESASQNWDFQSGAYLPLPPLPEPVKVVYSVHLWERLTDEEANQVAGVMQSQSVRLQNIFRSANSYRSDHELWSLLNQIATTLFGSDRAVEILAPSELIPAG